MVPYSGLENFAFVSYSHKDIQQVLKILDRLALAGTRIWYDEALMPSCEYLKVLAKKIKEASLFIAFISNNSLGSQYCLDEIHFAYKFRIPIMAIFIESCELPDWLSLMLDRHQHYYAEDKSPEEVYTSIFPMIPSQVVELRGTKLGSDTVFSYYLCPLRRGTGYEIKAFSDTENEQVLAVERFPVCSEYTICYTQKKATEIVFAVDVVWDYTYSSPMPDDDYFLEQYLYIITANAKDKTAKITKRRTLRQSYVTNEKIQYDYVQGVNTLTRADGSIVIYGTDKNGNRF